MRMPHSDQPLPRWISVAVVGGAFLGLTILELVRTLRPERQPKARRIARNLAIAGLGSIAVGLAEQPVVLPTARLVERRRWGLLRLARLPEPFRTLAGILLMDYTLYGWHVLTHRVPLLWRFHLPHHIDLDMDASTALRFHFGELLLSVPYRLAQITVIGVDVRAYSVWQTLLFACILFHHSNVRLPLIWERRLRMLLVTPHLHGIHHDATREHLNSNWSSGLTVWDWLHGTLQTDLRQEVIEVGVPAYLDSADVRLGSVIALPFREQRNDYVRCLTSGGEAQR